jgi:hypothetical protein
MKYFKIIFGFSNADYLPIDENELAMAIYLFIQGTGRAVFKNGVCRGQDILRIVPDWHKVKGWSPAWKMTADDFEDVRSLQKPYQDFYEQVKDLVHLSIKENNPSLLQGDVKKNLLPVKSLSSSLVDKMRI